jgi:membrane associated rhomboid family serine protease
MSLEFQNDANDGENTGVSSEIRQPISDTFPIYSAILIVCLIIVAAAQYIVDSNDGDFDGNKSIVLAGFLKKAFVDGQYWRSVTSGVMHSGLPHLFFNS